MRLRIARVLSVLIALGVGGWLVLRAQLAASHVGRTTDAAPEAVGPGSAQPADGRNGGAGEAPQLATGEPEVLDVGGPLIERPFLYSSKNPNLIVDGAGRIGGQPVEPPGGAEGATFLFSSKLGTVQVPVEWVSEDGAALDGSLLEPPATDEFLHTSKSLRLTPLAPKAGGDGPQKGPKQP